MALDVYDGFEKYLTPTADMLRRHGALQWQMYGANNTPTLSFVPGMEGDGKALEITGVGGFLGPNAGLPTQWPVAVFSERHPDDWYGIRLLCPGANNGALFFIYDTTPITGPAAQLTLWFNPSNYSISVYRGLFSALLGISANNVWTNDVYQYIAIAPVIDSSTGSVSIKVDGTQVVNITGANTQATANAWWDAAGFTPNKTSGSSGTTSSIILDDLEHGDATTGPGLYPFSTPADDLHVRVLPIVGNNAVQWTPKTGTNLQEISEAQMDSDTSYNSSDTPGQEDTFNLGPLPGVVNNIYAVQLTIAARKDDAGVHKVKTALITGATETYGPDNPLPNNDYAYFSDIYPTDPDTAASWTLTNANAMAAGYNLVS
jgi:hypothetical protein